MRRLVGTFILVALAVLAGACGSKSSSSSANPVLPPDPCSSVKSAQTALAANDLATARTDLAAALSVAQQQGDGKIAGDVGNDIKLVGAAKPSAKALAAGDPLLNDCGF